MAASTTVSLSSDDIAANWRAPEAVVAKCQLVRVTGLARRPFYPTSLCCRSRRSTVCRRQRSPCGTPWSSQMPRQPSWRLSLTCSAMPSKSAGQFGREGSMDRLTRLEKLLFRLEAQHICLQWIFREIAGRPGVVFEMGLGHGRTYDHLAHVSAGTRDLRPRSRGRLLRRLHTAGRSLAARRHRRHARRRRHALWRPGGLGACRPGLVRRSPQCCDEWPSWARACRPFSLPAPSSCRTCRSNFPGRERCRCPPASREGRYFLYRNGPHADGEIQPRPA